MENELTEVNTDKKGVQTVSARLLHEKLKIKTRFNDWINNMIEYGCFEEKKDYITITEKKVTVRGNVSTYFDYALMLDMAKEICMVQRSELLARGSITDEYGYHEVNPLCVDASEYIGNFVEERKQKRLERKRA